MDNVLRWGFLSTARINSKLIPGLSKSKRNQLIAVASRSMERAREYARANKIPKYYGSYEDMLADPEIDVVYISLPNHLHAEWTIRAAQAGKHVLCEKPIALSIHDVHAIQEAANEHGVVIMEAFMYLHHPQTMKVCELAFSDTIGEIKYLRGSFSFALNRPDDVRWIKEYGGGSLWDVGCYPVSFFHLITGTVPFEVSGIQISTPDDVDITFLGQMRYPNGIIAQFDSSFKLYQHTHFEIRGTKGCITVPEPFKPQEKPLIHLKTETGEKTIRVPKVDLYRGEIENMADSILDGVPQKLSLEESRQNIATISALYASSTQNTPIHLHIDAENHL